MENILYLFDSAYMIDHMADQNLMFPDGPDQAHNLIGWQPQMDLDFQSRNFLNKGYIYWLEDIGYDYRDLPQILPEDSSVRGLVKYCVYVKSNIIFENNIMYIDFLDNLLGRLNIDNDNYEVIINNPAFEKYLASLIRQIDVYAGLVRHEIPGILNFKVENPAKFADKVLDLYNYDNINNVTQQKMHKYILEAIHDLNKISKQPIEVTDIVKTPNTIILMKKALIVMAAGITTYCLSDIVSLPSLF
jgi:hypothetical protein